MTLLLLTVYCCKNEKSPQLNHISPNNKEYDKYLNFYFPDTVSTKKTYEGVLRYKGELDSIISDFNTMKGDTVRILSF